jgi:hypothetical protein
VRDAFDYVYERESLANLAGKKLAGKRNHMNAFLREYSEAKFLPLDAKRCLEFYPHWVDEHLMNEDLFFKAEGEGLVHILQNWDRTPFVGGMIEYKGRVIAFSISEVMNDEMAITHFEKADRNYRGSYTAINKWMAESLAVRYINREDDLGIEGLRHTKTMYRPVFMVEKFKVSRKGE